MPKEGEPILATVPPSVATQTERAVLRTGSDVIPARTLTYPVQRVDRSRAWLVAILLVGFLGALYWPVLLKLVGDWWDDPNYSHAFLVPFFSAFLVWQRRNKLAALSPSGTWVGVPVLVVGLALLLLGEVGGERFLAVTIGRPVSIGGYGSRLPAPGSRSSASRARTRSVGSCSSGAPWCNWQHA